MVLFHSTLHRSMNWIEGIFGKLTYWKKFMLGGAMLSILIFFLPPLYGEGYGTIETLLAGGDSYKSLMDDSFFYFFKSNWSIVVFGILIVLTKVFASSATNGAGELEEFLHHSL